MRIQSLAMHVLNSHVVHTFEVTGAFFFSFSRIEEFGLYSFNDKLHIFILLHAREE